MNSIAAILRAVVGLFVDDERLAVGVLGVAGFTALLIKGFGVEPLVAGGILLSGNLLVLAAGVIRTARRKLRA